MNLCKLIGHKVKFYDGPYPICERCGSHAYYDNYDFYFAWHFVFSYRLPAINYKALVEIS